jgi:hypothetical protein
MRHPGGRKNGGQRWSLTPSVMELQRWEGRRSDADLIGEEERRRHIGSSWGWSPTQAHDATGLGDGSLSVPGGRG